MREQAGWCERLGSPLYHGLLMRMAEDVEARGVCWTVLEPYAGDPLRSLVPLRFLGALHRLVLEGRFPELARYYPSAGGTADPEAAWITLRNELEDLSLSLPEMVQTNEVMRCRALSLGFLEIARATGLPMRLLEIGCSAGLNLRWDHFGDWARVDSPVVTIVERRGCDLNPVDPLTDEGRLTLLSFVWPDQTERFRRLEEAIDVASAVPAVIERADAEDWLELQLMNQRPGVVTVVFHSIVLLYLSNASRERVHQILDGAGKRATKEAPLAWLGMEPGEADAEVHLTLWPVGERKRIARADYHGRWVEVNTTGLP